MPATRNNQTKKPKPAVEDLSPDTLMISIFAMLIAMAWATVFDITVTTITKMFKSEEAWTKEDKLDVALRLGWAVLLSTFGVYFVRNAVIKYRVIRNKKNQVIGVETEGELDGDFTD